jgi:hypothetical protein
MRAGVEQAMTNDTHLVGAASQEETLAELERLIALAKAGDLHCVALRLFDADGSWQDVAFGGTEADREAMLAKLRLRH